MDDKLDIQLWHDIHVRQKPDKVVVKLRNVDGSFKESCITPTVMYPLNGKPEVFTYNNTCRTTDTELLKIFDSVKYNVGKCYQNTIDLVAALRENGYDVKPYVGWLYVSEHSYPIHHCWAVVNNHVLDLSDDYTIMFHGQNGKYFEDCKTVEEQRELMADFRKEAAKQPNSIRCAPVGEPSSFLLYIGCECEPNEGRKIYRDLIKAYPNHPVHSNVDSNGLNATQRLFKEKGLMQSKE